MGASRGAQAIRSLKEWEQQMPSREKFFLGGTLGLVPSIHSHNRFFGCKSGGLVWNGQRAENGGEMEDCSLCCMKKGPENHTNEAKIVPPPLCCPLKHSMKGKNDPKSHFSPFLGQSSHVGNFLCFGKNFPIFSFQPVFHSTPARASQLF